MFARKVLFIVFLVSLIASYFYLRPFFYGVKQEPSIVDRIPQGDFLGKIYLLDVARETNSFLYYNKLPFRDFLTSEFLLAQAKNYGLDLQNPIYFFANESGEWGSLVSINDSSKIVFGINRIKQDIDLKDTLVGGQKVTKIPKENIYMTYGKNWLFLYHGKQLPKRMYHVIYSKKNDIHPLWSHFLKQKQFSDGSIVVYSNWKKIKDKGVETALFSYNCDSIQLHLKGYLKSKEPLNLSVKDSGIALISKPNLNKYLSFHFDISKLRNNPEHPLIKWINEKNNRINFPINDFLNAWEGDLTLQQGGKQMIKETYIETEFDDEFNPTEVKKEKTIFVSGYTVLLSMNHFQKQFLSKLFAKGILRKENNHFYILTSPPLKLKQKPDHLLFYSSENAPKIITSKKNEGYWKNQKTTYFFNIDSLNNRELYFSVSFPTMNLLKKNKFLF